MLKSKNIKGFSFGLSSGLLWGLDTVLLGVVMAMGPLSLVQSAFLAPLVSTFLHDFFSSLWMILYTIVTGGVKNFFKSIKTKSALFIVIGALCGGPIGMTAYLLAIKYIGSGYTAAISSMYPAVAAVFAYIFLKDKLSKKGIIGLIIAISATIVLGFTTTGNPENILLGIIFALVCVLGWGLECVICAYGMKNDVTPAQALQIRQLISAGTYGILILPIIKGYGLVFETFSSSTIWILVITALVGTVSYLFYYNAIDDIGPSRAVALNMTYSAWTIILGLFVGQPLDFKLIIGCGIILFGSILTTRE